MNVALMPVVREFLTEESIVAADANQPDTVFFRLESDDLTWDCFIDVREDVQQILVYSVIPGRVPPIRRLSVAEYLTRANYGLPIGNFEIDLVDGEVRFKTSLDCGGDRLSIPLVRQLVRANATATERYARGLQLVGDGEAAPLDALRIAEGGAPNVSE